MGKFVLLGLAAFFTVLVLPIHFRPSEFRVSRSARFAARAETIFPQIDNFQNWGAWSPWAKMDPSARNTFSGPPAGVGASFAWSGNREVGEGKMTIIESQPPKRILLKLEFLKPFANQCLTEFMLVPQGDQTAVTWTMVGHNNFLAKAAGLFMDCDKIVGGQFEQGFSNLKAIVESRAKP